jgi:hypothetical protein
MKCIWKIQYTQKFKGYGDQSYTDTIAGPSCLLKAMERVRTRVMKERIQSDDKEWHDCIGVTFISAEKVGELTA